MPACSRHCDGSPGIQNHGLKVDVELVNEDILGLVGRQQHRSGKAHVVGFWVCRYQFHAGGADGHYVSFRPSRAKKDQEEYLARSLASRRALLSFLPLCLAAIKQTGSPPGTSLRSDAPTTASSPTMYSY